MGAWGTGSFENDDAVDWVADLEASDDLVVIEATLARVAEAGDAYLEVPDGASTVAAVEILAALLGEPDTTLADEARGWVASHASLGIPVAAVELASAALTRVRSDSQRSKLSGLWEDSGDAAKWVTAIEDLEQRLGRRASR